VADCCHVTISARALALITNPGLLRRARIAYRADPVYGELKTLSAAVLGYADATAIAITGPSADNWIMVNEAAKRLGVEPPAVRRALREGRLRGRKSGAVWLVDADDVNTRAASC